MSREALPHRPSLRQLKSLAKDLRKAAAARDAAALARVRSHHPRHAGATDDELAALPLQEAQLVVAREHGFDSWPRLAARLLHRLAGGGAWAEVHCDARRDTLGEADLFGFEPGAFTGAHASTPGALEQAAGGVALLVEVGDLSPSAQLRLFEAIENGGFRRLGGAETHPLDARLVCTTSVDLRQRAAAGTFREDLCFRLQVLRVDLPPLRERVEDIPALARHFAAAAPGVTTPPTFTAAALARLGGHPWAGNARELRHVVEAAVVAAGPVVDADVLRLEVPPAACKVGVAARPAAEGGRDRPGQRVTARQVR